MGVNFKDQGGKYAAYPGTVFRNRRTSKANFRQSAVGIETFFQTLRFFDTISWLAIEEGFPAEGLFAEATPLANTQLWKAVYDLFILSTTCRCCKVT